MPPDVRRLMTRSWLTVAWAACALGVFAAGFWAAQAVRTANSAAATPALAREAMTVDGVRFVTAGQVIVARRAESTTAPIFVDVRTSDEFAAAHISGALNIQVFQLPDVAAQLPRDRAWVLYCACPDDRLARFGAGAIAAGGLPNAVVLEHGLKAWVEAGGEFTTGGDLEAAANAGCGCSVGAEALKLWVIGRAQEGAAGGDNR